MHHIDPFRLISSFGLSQADGEKQPPSAQTSTDFTYNAKTFYILAKNKNFNFLELKLLSHADVE